MTFDVEIFDRYIPVGMHFFPILHAVDGCFYNCVADVIHFEYTLPQT
jgi:hypothetical protein